jgi:flagellar protein FlgJ
MGVRIDGTGDYNIMNKRVELKQACQQFESVFTAYLLKAMRGSIPKSGFLEQSFGFQIAQSLHDEALSEELSKTGCLGIADILYEQLSSYLPE